MRALKRQGFLHSIGRRFEMTQSQISKRSFIHVSILVLYLWALLCMLDYAAVSPLVWAVGASSLASSAFIVLFIPRNETLKLVGGYFICLISGVLFHYLIAFIASLVPAYTMHVTEMMTAVAIGLSVIVMVFTGMTHPPAAGMTVILIAERWGFATLGVILIAVLALSSIDFFLRSKRA